MRRITVLKVSELPLVLEAVEVLRELARFGFADVVNKSCYQTALKRHVDLKRRARHILDKIKEAEKESRV